jgi:hypothetical protein
MIGRALEQALMATQNYEPGAVPQAKELFESADRVLCRVQGMNFSVLAIVDASEESERRFELPKERAKAMLAACTQHYSGTLKGAKMPSALVVVELRKGVTDADKTRLKAYSNSFFDQDAIHAFLVDTDTREVHTATRFSWLAGMGWRRFLVQWAAEL